jgi:CheY-like chemotaxis protein
MSDLSGDFMSEILVVDDDAVIRALSVHLLESAGYRVAEASSGTEALGLMRKTAFDVLITDLFMPGMDGLELIHAVRTAGHHIHIIAMSGGGDPFCDKLLSLAQRLGADTVLRKPLEPAGLLDALAIARH